MRFCWIVRAANAAVSISRFATRVMPAPDMFVDLFDYRFLSLRQGGADQAQSYVSLLISRSGATVYIQVIHVAPRGGKGVSVVADARQGLALPDTDQPVAQALRVQGPCHPGGPGL